MAEKKEKAQYSKPSSQLDLEERQENENRSPRILSTSDQYEAPEQDDNARDFTVEDNELDGYVGTDPVYQNYAVDTDKPMPAEEGAESKLEKEFLGSLDPDPQKQDAASEDEEGEEGGGEASTPSTGASPSTGTTPAASSKTEKKD